MDALLNFELDYSIGDLEHRKRVIEELLLQNDGELNEWLSENFESQQAIRVMERISNYICGGKLKKEKFVSKTPLRKIYSSTNDEYGDKVFEELESYKKEIRRVRDLPENKAIKRLFNREIAYTNDNIEILLEAFLKPIRGGGNSEENVDPPWLMCDYKNFRQVMCLIEIPRQHSMRDITFLIMDLDDIFYKSSPSKLEIQIYEIFKTNHNIRQIEIAEMLGCTKGNVHKAMRSMAKKIVNNQVELEKNTKGE